MSQSFTSMDARTQELTKYDIQMADADYLRFCLREGELSTRTRELMTEELERRETPRIVPCNNGIGLYEIDETHETFDTLEEAKEALEQLKDVPTYPEPEGDPSY